MNTDEKAAYLDARMAMRLAEKIGSLISERAGRTMGVLVDEVTQKYLMRVADSGLYPCFSRGISNSTAVWYDLPTGNGVEIVEEHPMLRRQPGHYVAITTKAPESQEPKGRIRRFFYKHFGRDMQTEVVAL